MKKSTRATALFLALRYLFSKKKHNIINVISIVSMVGIAVSCAALIIVLSVFNGMEKMIGGWFNAFNPDLEITLVEGKSFSSDSFPEAAVAALPGVAHVAEIVSDLALVTYNDRQELLFIKGIDNGYVSRNGYDKLLIDGQFKDYLGEQPCAAIGSIAAGQLQIRLDSYDLLKVYYPKRTKKNFSDPANSFSTLYLFPTGVFTTNTANDETYLLAPIDFVRKLMQYEGQATSIEVKLDGSVKPAVCQQRIQETIGAQYRVRDKYQQEESLFKTMQSEKLVIYIILTFILLVAAFNITGSLGMLILEKKTDLAVLRTLGAETSLLRRIFIYEGILISFIGGACGLLFGTIICLIQQHFHLITLGNGGNYIIPYYPVQLEITDFALVGGILLLISLLTSFIPVFNIRKITLKGNRDL